LSSLTASYLIVAGGGGGGGSNGGGGAGGLLSGSGLTIDTNSNYVVTVGAGGTAASSSNGGNGGSSTFSMVTTTAVGGGGGGYQGGTTTGANGGSGGGGSYPLSAAGGTGTSGQGNAGGAGAFLPTQYGGGGGGGAGAVGGAGSGSAGGAGGVGVSSSISGTATYYAGGGGGGTSSASAGAGGNGGGGAGGTSSAVGTAGTTNTGGGGGGGSNAGAATTSGGVGGSGVVIISYAGSTQQMAGGTVTISGGNVIHTFTSSGYLTPIKYVNNSLRFRSSASAYLNRTPATAGNLTTWTWSSWVKRGDIGSRSVIFSANATDEQTIRFESDSLQVFRYQAGVGYTWNLVTTAVYRDPAAWYHLLVAYDTTQATAANRIKVYINGVQVSSFSTASYPTQNSSYSIDNTVLHTIGKSASGATYFDGYLTEINFIDGQALTPNSFGTFNSYGVWQPITYGGSYGTNGFYLPFTNKTSTTTLGYDFSPNGNNWTTNNISLTAGSTYDSMTDVPTLTSATAANYPTWNPLVPSGQAAPTDGNLSQINSTGCRTATMQFPQSGKWYLEWLAGSNTMAIVVGLPFVPTTQANSQTYSVGYYNNGNKYVAGTATAYGASFTSGDIIGLALDFTVSPPTITYYKNNTSQGAINLTSGIDYVVAAGIGGTGLEVINFGQRPFSYTPPSGYVALNTYNM